MDNNMKLSPPWITYFHEIEQLFEPDEEIKLVIDENANEIKMYVDNTDKANALAMLLPAEKKFGNITVKTTIYPPNLAEGESLDLFEKAFAGNPIMKGTASAQGIYAGLKYVIFENKVVQFFNDNLDDAHGVKSTLYQDIAKDVFGDTDGIFFCTDLAYEELGAPLGEWP